tara:strand:- start:44614 stop:45675 length:1062 start_codon:yes stop_codon:yes gene_type:complete
MNVNKTQIMAIATDILKAVDTPGETALRVVQSLTLADVRGVPTHGVGLLPLYCQMAAAGVIKVGAEPQTNAISDSMVWVDGGGAFGQLTGRLAVDLGVGLMQNHGIAAVGIADGTHLGRLGEWAERACDADAAFLAFANTGGGALNVAGADGAHRVLAPNPIAFGIPTCGSLAQHVIVDFATSQVAGSRIREVANAGGRLNPDWVIAQNGSSTDDPQSFLDGLAALRPLGGASAGHKGFGLMVAAEMLSALAGGLMAGERDAPWFSNGALFLLLDIRRFVPREDWGRRVKAFAEYVDKSGYRLPGTGRSSTVEDRLELAEHTVAALLQLAAELSVNSHGLSAPVNSRTVTQSW